MFSKKIKPAYYITAQKTIRSFMKPDSSMKYYQDPEDLQF